MNNWYAVYTRPRWEKKVVGSLTKRKIPNYCPLNKVVSQWSDRKKTIFQPLFTSYVFVNVDEIGLQEIKKLDGVINPVYWLGKPAIIKENEIEMLKLFLMEHQSVELAKLPVNTSDKVKIMNSPLMENEGSAIEVTANKIKLVLPSLGYSMIAEVAKDNVVLFTSPRHHHSFDKKIIS